MFLEPKLASKVQTNELYYLGNGCRCITQNRMRISTQDKKRWYNHVERTTPSRVFPAPHNSPAHYRNPQKKKMLHFLPTKPAAASTVLQQAISLFLKISSSRIVGY